MPSGMTSSKDRGEIKEKSILYYFLLCSSNEECLWQVHLSCPTLAQLLPTSHHLKVSLLPGTVIIFHRVQDCCCTTNFRH